MNTFSKDSMRNSKLVSAIQQSILLQLLLKTFLPHLVALEWLKVTKEGR